MAPSRAYSDSTHSLTSLTNAVFVSRAGGISGKLLKGDLESKTFRQIVSRVGIIVFVYSRGNLSTTFHRGHL